MLSHTLKSQISAQLSNVSQETLDAFAEQRKRNAEEYSALNVAGSIPVLRPFRHRLQHTLTQEKPQ